jgi:6-phosphogluconolactonase
MANKSLWPLSCVPVLLAGMLGCGSGSSSNVQPQPAKAEFLYTVAASGGLNNPGFQLSAFKIDASTGALSATSTLPLQQIAAGIAVDPGSRFLYVSDPNPSANFINVFSIDASTGAPTFSSGFLLSTICGLCAPPSGPGGLALDPSGKFLYYGSSTLGGVTQGIGALSVDSNTGNLSAVPGSPFPVNQAPIFVAAHPSGQFVYTEDTSGIGGGGLVFQSVSGFSVDSSTGALSPVNGSPFPAPAAADLAGFAIHPSGKFLYVNTGLAAQGILGWSIDGTTGKLAVLPGSPFAPGAASFGATFDPAGKFLYVSAGPGGGISGFSVDSNSGMLTPLASSPFFSGSDRLGPTLDPSGRFLFAVDTKNSAIAGYSVDAMTGTLTALGSPTALGAHPGPLIIVKAP